jgi:hypothetical protein
MTSKPDYSRHLHVETGLDALDATMRPIVVADGTPLPAPFFSQDVGEQELVFTCVRPV